MIHARLRLPPLAWVGLAMAQLAFAQPWCDISGRISDPSGATVPDTLVSIIHEDTGFRRVARTGNDGVYSVGALQSGAYKMIVRKDGFRTIVRFGVKLEPAQSARLDFELTVGSVQETITVTDDFPSVSRTDSSVAATFDRDEIEHVPENGSNLLSLIDLSPGAIVTPATRGEPGQFTVDGQRPNTNQFEVDGVSANTGVSAGGAPAQPTGAALPGMSAFGSLHSLIALEALQEMQVQVSTTLPQFGRLPGAQISLNSRSGSNDFHGSLLATLRPSALDARDWFADGQNEPQGSLALADYSTGAGGPIWRNHTFFFASYEGMRLEQGFAWQSAVPSLAARDLPQAWAQSVLNLYPAPTGPELGNGLAEWTGWSNGPAKLDVGSVRLDHAVTSRITVFGRFNIAPSSNQFGSTQVSQLSMSSQSMTLGANWLATPNTIFDVRFNQSSSRVTSFWTQNDPPLPVCSLQPVTSLFLGPNGNCDSLVRFSIGGISQVTSGNEGERKQSQRQVVDTVTLNRGRHAIRLGIDYLSLTPVRLDAGESLGVLADSLDNVGVFSSLWIARAQPRNASVNLMQLSAFAQDSWRITSWLTATAGLRWEFNPAPDSVNANFLDPKTGNIDPAAGPIWRNSYRNVAPRAGVAWRLDRQGRTLLRAGAGRYYDSSLSIATDLINGGPLSLSLFSSDRIPLFTSTLTYAFRPNLVLPVVTQWSASIEHAVTDRDTLSVAGVANSGRNLIRREIGGLGSSQNIWLALSTNDGSSSYHALHVQYRRSLAAGIQALAAYTWSHSIDDSSSDSELYWAGAGASYWNGARLSLNGERGSSDFDVRHAVSGVVTYTVPRGNLPRWAANWTLDGKILARTGFPINVLDSEEFIGLNLANAFRPDVVPGQPLWIGDPNAPGGRRLNPAAFAPAPKYVQGDLGRNAIAGFGMSQIDLAMRRDFPIRDSAALEFRLELFNALNHPDFADPVSFLNNPLFGHSTSMLNAMLGTGSPGSGLAPMFQSGGPRSVQFTLRLRF